MTLKYFEEYSFGFFLLHRTFLIWSCLMFPSDYIQMNCSLIKYYISNIPSFLSNTSRKPNYFQCGIQGLYILTFPRIYTHLLILTTEPCLADLLGISQCSICLAGQSSFIWETPSPKFLTNSALSSWFSWGRFPNLWFLRYYQEQEIVS